MFYLNITGGLAIISQEKDIMAALTNSTGQAVFTVGLISLVISLDAFFNAAGRIGFASWSDHLQDRNMVYKIIFLMSAGMTLLMFVVPTGLAFYPILMVLTFFAINAGYGGGFSSLPPLLADRFGMKAISKIHGLTLSAWAFAGLSGNQLASFILNGLNMSYQMVFLVIGILYVIAYLISVFLVKPTQMIVE